MNKGIVFILSVLIIVSAVLTFIYFDIKDLTQKSPNKPYPKVNNNLNTSSKTKAQEQPPSIFKIIYQDPKDKEGRTVVYNYSAGWSGVGLQSNLKWAYIIGSFNNWQDINNSYDRYIQLTNPLTNKFLEKVRIIYTQEGFNSFANKPTRIGIENLNKLQEGKDAEEDKTAFISSLSKDKVSSLIKRGDALVIFLSRDINNNLIRDNNNSPIASWLFLRRYKNYTENISL